MSRRNPNHGPALITVAFLIVWLIFSIWMFHKLGA